MDVSPGSSRQVRLLTAADGVRIAVAETGAGHPRPRRPLAEPSRVRLGEPIWRDFLAELAAGRRLVRYDERGTGLSDREVEDMSFEAMVGDLETVVDELGLERFALLGMSQGAAISIAYAVRHPERVTALVLCGGYARGHAHRGRTPEQQRDAELLLELIRVGWGTPNPKFRRVFATMFLPEARPSSTRPSTSSSASPRRPRSPIASGACSTGSTSPALCAAVRAPTLVMHVRGDGVVPVRRGAAARRAHPGLTLRAARGHRPHPRPGRARLAAVLRRDAGIPCGHLVRQRGPGGDRAGRRAGARSRPRHPERSRARGDAARGRGPEQRRDRRRPRAEPAHGRAAPSNVYAKLGIEGKAARAAAAARVSRAAPR